jgi:hypothetical protein
LFLPLALKQAWITPFLPGGLAAEAAPAVERKRALNAATVAITPILRLTRFTAGLPV